MVADPAPTKAKLKKNEAGGRGLEADELGHEFSLPSPTFPVVCRGTSPGERRRRPAMCEACVVANCAPHWSFQRMRRGRQRLGQDVLTFQRVQSLHRFLGDLRSVDKELLRTAFFSSKS